MDANVRGLCIRKDDTENWYYAGDAAFYILTYIEIAGARVPRYVFYKPREKVDFSEFEVLTLENLWGASSPQQD
jgi:hypothetical protein